MFFLCVTLLVLLTKTFEMCIIFPNLKANWQSFVRKRPYDYECKCRGAIQFLGNLAKNHLYHASIHFLPTGMQVHSISSRFILPEDNHCGLKMSHIPLLPEALSVKVTWYQLQGALAGFACRDREGLIHVVFFHEMSSFCMKARETERKSVLIDLNISIRSGLVSNS